MARFEKDFSGGGLRPLSLDELLTLLGDSPGDTPSPDGTVARCLSASDGWEEAARELRGAFATGGTGLRKAKDD